MAGCKCENWTLEELSNALQDMHKENKRIVVPMFQRGKRWKKPQEHKFIDSLIKGYPVGTMLFYETYEDDNWTYILVDGLQRGNSIKKYMTNPTEFFYDDSISDEFCAGILKTMHQSGEEKYAIIRTILTDFIKEQNTFKNLQYYRVARQISDALKSDVDVIEALIDMIQLFFKDRQALYDKISGTIIPVIVYTGDENNLPEIFDRINSQGTPLDQYEVYAAAWPVRQKYVISNSEIVEYVVRKYDTFTADGYQLHGYCREAMRTNKQLSAFEYLFGLGKYLVHRYDILAFNTNLADDTVNPIAFELVNACLNDTDKIKSLYKNFSGTDVDLFERALGTAIDYVDKSISVITNFKGNTRSSNRIFHSKYQILSMVATTFKAMYENGDFSRFSDAWQTNEPVFSKNLVQYYVYDIITNYWSEGGPGKVHSVAKTNRYMTGLSGRAWIVALDGFFERSMLRAEKRNIANPRKEEYVVLNCIYLNTFTAMDQLSRDRFDVEHIAPKDQMRKLIDACNGEGLPISCVANLCYLPESINRSKGAKNFYQDKKYLVYINLEEVEKKYSFTEEEDLEWMDQPYQQEDFPVLKEYYTDYCTKRFEKMKRLFCESMGIDYEGIAGVDPAEREVVAPAPALVPDRSVKFADKCVVRMAQHIGKEVIKVGRSTYITADKEQGFIITTSKMYKQGNREKYWFAYRRNPLENLNGCRHRWILYGCKDESTIIRLPVEAIEEQIDRLNISRDEEGKITHWHMVFYKDEAGTLTWLLSKPFVEERNVTQYTI